MSHTAAKLKTTRKAKKLRTQPRIPGVRRIPGYNCLLPVVRQNLLEIAKAENKSLSWVIAEVVNRYFGLTVVGDRIRLVKGNRV